MGIKYEISDNLKIAYKLDEEALKNLNILLESFANSVQSIVEDDISYYLKKYDGPKYTVDFKDNSSRKNLSFNELLSLSNAGSKEIVRLEADANLLFFEYNINIRLTNNMDFSSPVYYRFICNNEKLYYTYQAKIIDFMDQIEQSKIYSKIRTNDFIFIYLVFIPILLVILFTLASFGLEFLLLKIVNYNEFISLLLSVTLPILGIVIKNFLLPAGEIHIGKGKERAERLKNIRNFLLGTILFTLIADLINSYRE